jgi:hypothetical protein
MAITIVIHRPLNNSPRNFGGQLGAGASRYVTVVGSADINVSGLTSYFTSTSSLASVIKNKFINDSWSLPSTFDFWWDGSRYQIKFVADVFNTFNDDAIKERARLLLDNITITDFSGFFPNPITILVGGYGTYKAFKNIAVELAVRPSEYVSGGAGYVPSGMAVVPPGTGTPPGTPPGTQPGNPPGTPSFFDGLVNDLSTTFKITAGMATGGLILLVFFALKK